MRDIGVAQDGNTVMKCQTPIHEAQRHASTKLMTAINLNITSHKILNNDGCCNFLHYFYIHNY